MDSNEVNAVLAEPIARELLATFPLARLAYTAPDGSPRVVPIGFAWDGARLTMCTPSKAPKVRALRADPRVALTIDAENPPRVLLIRGEASVEIVDGVPNEFIAANTKGESVDQRAEFEAQARGLYERMARISIEPRWAKLIDFETKVPVAVEEILRSRAQRRA